MGRSRRTVGAIVLLTLVVAVLALRPVVHGLAFVVRAAEMQGTIRKIADLDARRVTEQQMDIDVATGPSGPRSIPGRLYQPEGRPRRFVLLTSGLHPAGIAEPRLVALARQLAATGLAVVTPDIPELSRFEITPAITDGIEGAAVWVSKRSTLAGASASDGRVGLIGISFSGGLSVVAAGRPSLRDRVAYVLSFGGHDDLPRVLRYLCTGSEPLPPGQLGIRPDSTGAAHPDRPAPVFVRAPHDYGVAVILLGVADRLVPPSQVDPLREAVRRFLLASSLDRLNKKLAQERFAEVRALESTLPEPSATLLRYVNDRDVVHLGVRLLPFVSAYGTSAGLSPSRSALPSAPVFLLHGTDDNVIPTIETEYLAASLRGRTPVRLLLSDLISHADADQPPHLGDVAKLAGFWGDLLTR